MKVIAFSSVDWMLKGAESECARLGGELIVRPEDRWESDVEPSPFQSGLGLCWKRSRVYVDAERNTTPSKVAAVVHEMGHVFAQCDLNEPEEEFIGWEFAMACRLGFACAWYRSMSNYQIFVNENPPVTADFGQATREERMGFMRNGLRVAQRKGLVVRGVPMSIR